MSFGKIFLLLGLLNAIMPIANAEPPHWTYDEQVNNPSNGWGALLDDKEKLAPYNFPYAECSIGQHQSPVALSREIKPSKINLLSPYYPKDRVEFFNTGHAVQLVPSDGYKGRLMIGKESYPLTQIHFHSPSEHLIESEQFDAEAHFVHVRDDGRIAVLGVMFKVSNYGNPVVDLLLNNTLDEEHSSNKPNIWVDLSRLLPNDLKHFYTYAGSLTTPPCSEGVAWYVLSEPLSISESQLMRLQGFYKDNFRVTQPLNGRVVTGVSD